MVDRGPLGGTFSEAFAINDSGQMVGDSTTTSGAYDAFVSNGTTLFDLNNLLANGAGWQLTEATAINASGQITGVGTIDGQQHAFALTPSPEPAAWMAAALALAGLCAMRARSVRG